MTAPGPAPDRAAAELAEAEQRVRALLTMRFLPAIDDLALEIVLAELDRQRAELDRLHTWAGLIELLDEHWPADIFPGGGESGDLGPRVVGLIRECDRQRARIAAVLAECDWWAARTRSMPISRVRALLEGEGR